VESLVMGEMEGCTGMRWKLSEEEHDGFVWGGGWWRIKW